LLCDRYTPKVIDPRSQILYDLARATIFGVVTHLTRNSAIADKPARRVYRSVKVTKHSTIPYVRHFSYCAIVTLSLRHAVFTIFDFKKS